MLEATICLMQLPCHPETDRVIQHVRKAITQLERQNPLSSLHPAGSKVANSAAQASRTPGGSANWQPPRRQQAPHATQEEQHLNGRRQGHAFDSLDRFQCLVVPSRMRSRQKSSSPLTSTSTMVSKIKFSGYDCTRLPSTLHDDIPSRRLSTSIWLNIDQVNDDVSNDHVDVSKG